MRLFRRFENRLRLSLPGLVVRPGGESLQRFLRRSHWHPALAEPLFEAN